MQFHLKSNLIFSFCIIYLAVAGYLAAIIDFDAEPNRYFESEKVSIQTRSDVLCCTKCGFNDSCLAVNYNRQTSECELLAQSPINRRFDGARQNWTLFTRKLDACFGVWSSFNQSLYFLSIHGMSWSEADTCCKKHKGELADIHSLEENEYLEQLVGNSKYAWIGLRKNGSVIEWSSGRTVTFNNIYYSSNGDNCFVFYTGGWETIRCSYKPFFICEKAMA